MVVTSFKNEQVRFLKSLSQKKYREEHRVFFAEGLNVVSEGIKSGADVRKIVFSESFASAEGFRKICGELLTPSAEGPDGPRYAQAVGKVLEEALVLSDPVFESVSLTETPQGIGAIFGMGGTALHTRYVYEPAVGKDCRRLTLTFAQYDALVEYILSSGRRNADGSFVHIDQAGGGWSNAFYEGTGRYSLFFTCNSWANSALKACGQRCCLWTPLQQPIFWRYPRK